MTPRDEQRVGWCPGALRPMLTGDGLLLRVRPRAGAFTLAALEAIAGTARRFGSGSIDLTNRANLQIRGVSGATLPAAVASLAAAGLLDSNAGAEAIRNVVVDPLAGLDPRAVDVRPIAVELEAWLAGTTALYALPGKFGFSLDGGSHAPGPLQSDIMVRALSRDTCRIVLNGDVSMAALVAPDDAAETLICIATEFLAIASRNRDVRRMRDAVRVCGAKSIFAACGVTASPIGRETEETPPTPIGILAEAGSTYAVGTGFPFGRIRAEELETLCAQARASGAIEGRPTCSRCLVFPTSSPAGADAILALAGGMRLIVDAGDPRLRMDACPGAPYCPRATTSTRDDAESLIPVLAALGTDAPTVHVSGCAKGCARRAAADWTFVAHDGVYDLIRDGAADAPPVMTSIPPRNLAATVAEFAAGAGR